MPDACLPRYVRLESALAQFIAVLETQGQRHIKPLHQHIAIRLVIEGGFHPDEITPHPPLILDDHGGRHRLVFEPSVESATERTVLGGLKTKDIDVVVTRAGVGPLNAITMCSSVWPGGGWSGTITPGTKRSHWPWWNLSRQRLVKCMSHFLPRIVPSNSPHSLKRSIVPMIYDFPMSPLPCRG
jgi:hypothetical protein